MRRVLVLALLALALPMAAWADGIDLVNKFGTISISAGGITSTGSQLKQFNGVVAAPGHSLGSVSFSTGALIGGSIQTGGTFSDVGSSFVVPGTGPQVPHQGTIFSGAFAGAVSGSAQHTHLRPPPKGGAFDFLKECFAFRASRRSTTRLHAISAANLFTRWFATPLDGTVSLCSGFPR